MGGDNPTVVINDVRFVVNPLCLAMVRYLVERKDKLQGAGQLVFDYGSDGFVPKHTQIESKVKVT